MADIRPDLRYTEDHEWARPDGDVVVEHTTVDPAFTVAVEGGLFNFASVRLTPDVHTFAADVARVSEAKRDTTELEPFEGVRDDVLFMSCVPWLAFTSLTHPVHTDRVDSVPRIAWGRMEKVHGRVLVPVNIQVHHALVDGAHLGAFFGAL